jgi:hypothetical protein
VDRFLRVALALALTALPTATAYADGLAGSPSSMVHQHEVAVKEDYSFLRTPNDVRTLTSHGALVPVTGNANLTLSKVSYPVARPEVRDFVQRFAASYHEATGTSLVVTSLTRPTSAQPRNAHVLSVHPAGMAVDFRVPASSGARAYLESALLALERAGVLDVTRERSPAHYHVAVFADAYRRYAASQDSIATIVSAARARTRDLGRSAATAPAAAIAPAHEEPRSGLLLGLLALVAFGGPTIFRASRAHRA